MRKRKVGRWCVNRCKVGVRGRRRSVEKVVRRT
jgi:hypothetical protein